MNRRQFLKIGSLLVAAPAIVRIESLMPVQNRIFFGQAIIIDGVTVIPNPILLRGQTDSTKNGIYYLKKGKYIT